METTYCVAVQPLAETRLVSAILVEMSEDWETSKCHLSTLKTTHSHCPLPHSTPHPHPYPQTN
jgi:hypothetical protein